MLEKIGSSVEGFLTNYGASFLMMVIAGFCVALVVELSVKKAFIWLEEKLAGKDKVLAALDVAKMSVIFLVTLILTFVSVKLLLVSEMALPGNKALAPFWFVIIYLAQYIFSMYGIKGLLKWLKTPVEEKEPKVKKEKPKKVNPVEGFTRISRNCYKDPATGKFYDKKGNQL